MAAAAAATSAPSGRQKLAGALGIGALKRSQLEVLQSLVTKHLVDPAMVEIANTEDFTQTSLQRGIPRYEHAHLVAALDVILAYQMDRRAKGCGFMSMRKSYKHDPRTRLCELLKRWLRTNAQNSSITEDEVRRMCSLCRDVLNYPRMFPSKNPRSFMHTLAEVYDHLQLQLKEVLKRDRTCAELAAQALSISRNLIADAIAFMFLAATDLKQTDRLPSMEVVSLWQSLPPSENPLPGRAVKELQDLMKDGWKTLCGSLVAALLSTPWAFRLFGGASAQDEAAAAGGRLMDRPRAPSDVTLAIGQGPSAATSGARSRARSQPAGGRFSAGSQGPARSSRSLSPRGSSASAGAAESSGPMPDGVPELLARVEEEFDKERFGKSGLAGPFRERDQKPFRLGYLAAIESIYDLLYLLGEVLVHFQRISEGLGDYGMIRVSPWLHPFLEALVQKVQRLKGCLEAVNKAVEQELVIAKARGRKIKAPAPTERQSARAHASIERAITGRDSHAQSLVQVLEDLRAQSAPERLPTLMDDLGDACSQLEGVLFSPHFRACVGDHFPELPSLRDQATAGLANGSAQPALQVD